MKRRLTQRHHTHESAFHFFARRHSALVLAAGCRPRSGGARHPGRSRLAALLIRAACAPPLLLLLGLQGACAAPSSGPLAVLIAGDEEYRSEETLPLLAILLESQGFQCRVLQNADPARGPGLAALDDAGLIVLFTRFRSWPEDERLHLERALARGVPLVGLRTATHAFAYGADAPAGARAWSADAKDPPGGFGGLWFGDSWVAHHGGHGSESTRAVPEPSAAGHPVLRGFTSAWGPTDVYAFHPLPKDCVVLARGLVLSGMLPQDPPVADGRNDPPMPLAWVREFPRPGSRSQRVFYCSMGASQDLLDPGLRRLLVQACLWAVHQERRIPPQGVTLPEVGAEGIPYTPSPFGFHAP